jgi:hypothetical protein
VLRSFKFQVSSFKFPTERNSLQLGFDRYFQGAGIYQEFGGELLMKMKIMFGKLALPVVAFAVLMANGTLAQRQKGSRPNPQRPEQKRQNPKREPPIGIIKKFEHVIVIVQENRTPDNLFQGLCNMPSPVGVNRCSTKPGPKQYNIQRSGWLDKTSPGGKINPTPIPLANQYDLDHSHTAFLAMCDESGGACKMDGANAVKCVGTCPPKPQFKFVPNTNAILNPYLELATQYGWANYMFQTNQGPSYPAHQFLFGGTSAPSAADDAKGTYASENVGKAGIGTKGAAGCIAGPNVRVPLIKAPGIEPQNSQDCKLHPELCMYPCFEHETMGDLFRNRITWRYYTPSAGSIWTAPTSIKHICESTGEPGKCDGPEWKEHVDLNSSDVLQDIANCNLRNVSWVIPTCANSDHARCTDGGGPSWVASIVNSVGNATQCDNGGYWRNTAIFITWDDWGGWYDHEPPEILPQPQGDYQYGFRVPLLVGSAYTPPNYINNAHHDFGSILRFVEHNFGIKEGELNFADERSKTNLMGFFDFALAPRQFREIRTPKNATFFLNDKRKATDPDDQ